MRPQDKSDTFLFDTYPVNQQIFALWSRFYADDADIWIPQILPLLSSQSMLCIGLNPSFSVKGFAQILVGTPHEQVNPAKFYHWRNRCTLDLAVAAQIENLAKTKYTYFAKFREIATYLDVPWEHIDLFFDRQTDQSKFKQRIYSRGALNQYATEQLLLSHELIKRLQPRIIVVANATASDIFVEQFGAQFSEQLGCHLITLNEQKTPVFLSSMLTGQRALDRYSFQRLKWHMGQVLKGTTGIDTTTQ